MNGGDVYFQLLRGRLTEFKLRRRLVAGAVPAKLAACLAVSTHDMFAENKRSLAWLFLIREND